MHQWICQRDAPHSRRFTEHKPLERTAALASRLPLNEALEGLKEYERAYMRRNPLMASEYRVLGITALPPETDLDALLALDVHSIEGMLARQGNEP